MSAKKTSTNFVSSNEALIADAVKSLPPLCTVKEASTVLRISERHLRRMVDAGRLRTLKNVDAGSSRVLVPRTELGRLLAEMVRS